MIYIQIKKRTKKEMKLFNSLCSILRKYAFISMVYQDIILNTNAKDHVNSQNISCYEQYVDGDALDISDDPIEPPIGNSIFFHETSCPGHSKITIDPLYACAVESAARLHPSRTVYLLYNAPIIYPAYSRNLSSNDRMIRQLMKYDNVKIQRLNMKKYVQNTPLQRWYATVNLRNSTFPAFHASDVLRYLTLWKYKGTYLDLDMIVMKNLDDLGVNYVARDYGRNINSAIMNLHNDRLGRRLAMGFIEEIRHKYRGNERNANGPILLTRVFGDICNGKTTDLMTPKDCKGFSVLNPKQFYPINWKDFNILYSSKNLKEVLYRVKDSYTLHVWKNVSKNRKINNSDSVPLGFLAKRFCPQVFSQIDEMFY